MFKTYTYTGIQYKPNSKIDACVQDGFMEQVSTPEGAPAFQFTQLGLMVLRQINSNPATRN